MRWLETREGDLLNVAMISRIYVDEFTQSLFDEESCKRDEKDWWDVNATLDSEDYVIQRFESEEEAGKHMRKLYNSLSTRYF